MLLVVNYHYVARERRPDAHAIYPVTTAAFEAQIDELARSFELVGRDDVLGAVDGIASLPARACLVTFDDGLRAQVELALPVLEARGAPGLFFVCGRPLVERRVLFAHKVHLLREAVPDDELLASLEERLAGASAGPAAFTDDEARAAYRYDPIDVARLKYFLNVALGPARPEVVDGLFAERFDEPAESERLYASPAQVAELEARGFLGAHGYAHVPLAALPAEAARADVERGAAVLADVAGERPRAFSYPYGTPAAVSPASAEAVRACGFAAGFTLERAFNVSLDEPLLLARLDTNDAPGGAAPLFEVRDDSIELCGAMTHGRTRYLQEAA